MSVTGSGTQANPYIVSTIQDIDMAFTMCRGKDSAGTYYVRLAGNINGNWQEWPLDLDFHSGSDRMIDFDLNGHEICNFTCGGGWSRLGCMAGDTFRNGSIYNIFRETGLTYLLSSIKFVDMSVSAYIKEAKSEIFSECEYIRTALWLKVVDYNAQSGYTHHPLIRFHGYSYSDTDGPYQLEESDMMIIIDNVNTAKCVIFEANSPSSPIIGEDSRIQGGITNITPDTITEYPAIMSSSVATENSVINFEMPDYSGTVSSGQPTTIVGTGTTGVINSDLIHESTYASYTMVDLRAETDAKMHSSAELTEDGFPVYVVRR